MQAHYMLSGSHERPSGPECRCGQPYSVWQDMCLTEHKALYPERYADEKES